MKIFKIAIIPLILIVVIGFGYRYFNQSEKIAEQALFYDDERLVESAEQAILLPTSTEPALVQAISNKISQSATHIAQSLSKPSVLLDLPFTSQAPTGDWNHPFNEACEEASMLMVYAWKNNISLNSTNSTKLINEMYDWQTKNGYEVDINAAQTSEVLNKYYHLEAFLIKNPTVEDLIQELSNDRPIIVPAAGRELNNPNFQTPGPLYHMLVIIGYDQGRKEFITHDPGTRNGKNFRYPYETIMNSIRDWNGGDVYNGEKVVVVVR